MGIIRMGPPWPIVLEITSIFDLTDFIETGTYSGNTALEAALHFNKVVTIENSETYYNEVIDKHGKVHNIEFVFGDSRTVLKKIIPNLDKPAVFWLDGHWCGGESYGKQDQCPLIDEIEIINSSDHAHFLFIDDARLFMSPPPIPNEIKQWPNISEVIYSISAGLHDYYIVIFEDVIVAVPEYSKKFISEYCQKINTIQWKEYGKAQMESRVIKGFRQVMEGTKNIVRALRANVRHIRASKINNS